MHKQAFTLVELLVVVSIVALLLAILLPSLSRARSLAEQVVCGSNERQLMSAAIAYASQNDQQFPYQPAWNGTYANGSPYFTAHHATTDPQTQPNWVFSLLPYVGDVSGGSNIWICPGIEDRSLDTPTNTDANGYAANGVVTQLGGDNFRHPASVAAIADDVLIHSAAILRPHWVWTDPSQAATAAGWSGWMRFQLGTLLTDRPHEGKYLAYLDGHAEHLAQTDITSGDFGLLINGQDTYETQVAGYDNPLRTGVVQR